MMGIDWKAAIAAAISMGVALATPSLAQDRVAAVPDTKVLLENNCVRVYYNDMAVGEKVPMHSHPRYFVYAFKPFKTRVTLADGTQHISEHRAGDVYWNEPITHSAENIGQTDIHNLNVELKPGCN